MALRYDPAPRAHAYALVFGGSGLCARMRTDEAGEPVFRPDPAPPRRTARAVNQPLLGEVAKLLQANPQIHSLDVEGHADDRERNPDGLTHPAPEVRGGEQAARR